MNNILYSFLFLISVLQSCKKENEPEPVIKPDTTTISTEPFKNVPALSDMVFYEINIRSFSAAGNFKGIEARLDSIQKLGINVVWLMPIYPVGVEKRVGELGSPYSVQNYTEVNPEFGELNDLKRLVSESHKRNMAVVLDWVANHTSWDNPWIENKDWYTQDASGNIVIPAGTNWQDVADLNYSNAGMRLEMIKSMKYWVNAANIDGFRCDAADFVPFDFWKQAIDSLKNIPNRNLILLAEGSRSDHYTAGFQLNYAWDFYGKLQDIFSKNENASNIFEIINKENNGVPSGKYRLRYITNHDEYAWTNSPVVQYVNESGSLAAYVATAFVSTVPLIYAGQEIAYPSKIPFFEKYPLDWSLNPNIMYAYEKVMQVRKGLEAVRKGNLKTFTNNDVIAFKKSTETENVLVIVNTRNKPVSFKMPDSELNINATNALTNEQVTLPSQIELKAFEYQILKY